jgi:hypothetical protein
MITLEEKINMDLSYPIHKPYHEKDVLFFDIETTGFSANTSFLYLIGCMYYKNDSWYLTQWLADDINGEIDLIKQFSVTLKQYKRLIHFNGSGFDIPFILQKCKKYSIDNPFELIDSFDLYKKILPLKKLLPLPNYKLKTIEQFVDFKRIDTYSGEELIQVYTNFLGRIQYERLHENLNNISEDTSNIIPTIDSNSSLTSKDYAKILLTHNSEDIKGLLKVSEILNYADLLSISEFDWTEWNHQFNIPSDVASINSDLMLAKNDTSIHRIFLTLPFNLNKTLTWTTPFYLNTLLTDDHTKESTLQVVLTVQNNKLSLQIPVIENELKYFYENPKDYFYLPKEDMAIHKSVAQYVDKEFRTRAKPSNCYIKKTGLFLIQPEGIFSPNFRLDYGHKLNFFESSNPDLTNNIMLYNYVCSLLRFILTNKETTIHDFTL